LELPGKIKVTACDLFELPGKVKVKVCDLYELPGKVKVKVLLTRSMFGLMRHSLGSRFWLIVTPFSDTIIHCLSYSKPVSHTSHSVTFK
jgi:hypothetical protein